MKTQYYLTAFAVMLTTVVIGQESETITLGPGTINQSFYSLENGEIHSVDNMNWDLAFTLSQFSATIRINDGMGVSLYKYDGGDIDSWDDVDTLGVSSQTSLRNSEESWSDGAFNVNSADMDMGWGNYDPVTHFVTGDSIYLIQTTSGDWRKIVISNLSAGAFNFQYADIDGSNEISTSINQGDFEEKNFIYYSLTTDTVIDREPLSNEWDITFTKYSSEVGPGMFYGVVGVLSNYFVQVAEVNDLSTPLTYDDFESNVFEYEMNAIGSDWKTFNMATFTYDIEDSRCYFVKDLEGGIYRLVFTGYSGSSTGEIEINKQLISGNYVEESLSDFMTFQIYPNPSSDVTSIILDTQASKVLLSIYDMSGKEIMSRTLSGGFQVNNISVADLESGIYVVTVKINGNITKKKLIIQ